jgi:hypothetical protein
MPNKFKWKQWNLMRTRHVIGCLILQPILVTAVFSQDSGTEQDRKRTAPAVTIEADLKASEMEAWIEQLNEPSLSKRRKAKESLVQSDAAAIPFLAKAALSDKRELIVYSLEVLGTLMEKSPSEETRKAAKITLQMLSESDQPSTADRAKQILGTKSSEQIAAFPGWNDPNSGFGNGFGVKRSVSASNSNGVKTIRIEEDGKVTTFRDEPRGAIRVSIEEGGKKKEFVAKNLGDLKKKDPAAHALYEEHSKGLGGAMGFVGGFPPGGFPANGFNGAFGGVVNGGAQQFGQFGPNQVNGAVGFNQQNFQGGFAGNAGDPESEAAAKDMMIQQLDELKKRLADNPAMTQILDSQIQALKTKAAQPKK